MTIQIQPPLIISPSYGILNYTSGDVAIIGSDYTLIGNNPTDYPQLQSDWEIWTGPDGTGNLVFQIYADQSDLTFIDVPGGAVGVGYQNTIFYIRVRYYATDSTGTNIVATSDWSQGNAFGAGFALLEQVPAQVCPNPITNEPCFDPFLYSAIYYQPYPSLIDNNINFASTFKCSSLKPAKFIISKTFSNAYNNNVKNLTIGEYNTYKPTNHNVFGARCYNYAKVRPVKCKVYPTLTPVGTVVVPTLFSAGTFKHSLLFSITFCSKIYPAQTIHIQKPCSVFKLGFNNSSLRFLQPSYTKLCRTYEAYRPIPVKICHVSITTGLVYRGSNTPFGVIFKQSRSVSSTGNTINRIFGTVLNTSTLKHFSVWSSNSCNKNITNVFELQKWRCSSIIKSTPLKIVFTGRVNSAFRYNFTKVSGRI